MHKIFPLAITAALLMAAGPGATAQTVYRALPQTAARAARVPPAIDPVLVLQSRLTRLEHKVNALQSTIDRTQPTLTFSCADNITSQNSVGVGEDCTPYACAPIDGRCRTSAKSSNDCASGYNWVDGGGCLAAQ